ncbi:MAG: Uma2 family endonuclease [Acidobacteriota bacterium]|nr:Uma2 family endonuclease [Acidobacteriota bacterium]
MATIPLVSVEDYLLTSYRPDCDYLEGVVRERHLGQFDHARLQTILAALFVNNEGKWGVLGLVEQRLRVRPDRYRVPDLLVVPLDYDRSPVVEIAPLLCIEIVSPDDRLKDLTERAQDYLDLGVPETWIFDPLKQQAYLYSVDGLHQVPPTAELHCGRVELVPAVLFSQL